MADEGGADFEPKSRVPGRPDPNPRPLRPPPSNPTRAERGRTITVKIAPRHLRVTPGQIETASVSIRYHGAVVDELTLAVTGESASWAKVAPDSLNVYPDTEAQAIIRFAPPRAPSPAAGLMKLGLEATSASDPDASTIQQASIEIEPFDELQAEPDGTTNLRGSHEAVLTIKVRNLGNRPAKVNLRPASTPSAIVSLSANSLTLEPGGEASVWITIQPQQGKSSRAGRIFPFSVSVSSQNSPPITIDGRMEQLAAASRWPLALAGIAGLALVTVGVAAVIFFGGGGPAASPSPTAAGPVTPSAGPSGSATVGPTTLLITATPNTTPQSAPSTEPPSAEPPSAEPPSAAPPTTPAPTIIPAGFLALNDWSLWEIEPPLSAAVYEITSASVLAGGGSLHFSEDDLRGGLVGLWTLRVSDEPVTCQGDYPENDTIFAYDGDYDPGTIPWPPKEDVTRVLCGLGGPPFRLVSVAVDIAVLGTTWQLTMTNGDLRITWQRTDNQAAPPPPSGFGG
jgi:hypothetical protein